MNSRLYLRCDEVGIPKRAIAALRRSFVHVTLIGELVQVSETAFFCTRGVGRKTFLETTSRLAELGLRLGMALPDDWLSRRE